MFKKKKDIEASQITMLKFLLDMSHKGHPIKKIIIFFQQFEQQIKFS